MAAAITHPRFSSVSGATLWSLLMRVLLPLNVAAAVLGAGAAHASPAPEARTQAFNLPLAGAVVTLKQFSEETGLQLVYLADALGDTRTNPVQGVFTPRQALRLMLEGTGLLIVEDPRTGALLITPRSARPAATAAGDSPAATLPMKTKSPLALFGAWLALAVTSAPGIAAEPAASKELTQLAAFVVTGSNIPTAADAVAVPVTIIGQADIERTGLDTNLLEVLQKRVPSFAGSGNLGFTNGNTAANNTYGGSQISLRSLSTLVLLDGRRVPDNGAGARGSRAFVDVNQFPLAAIQTVEVLTDGASAIYGSDAVGGVVNVKLRHDFNGLEFGGRHAFSNRQGNYSERSGYLVAGVKGERVSVTVSLSKSRLTPLYQADRPFSNPQIGKTALISGAVSPSSATFPTAFLRSDLGSPSQAVATGPGATAADLSALVAAGVYQASSTTPIANTYDLAPSVTLTLRSRKQAATLAGVAKLVPERLEFFVEAIDSVSDSFSQLAALGVNATVPVNSPFNPTRSSIYAAFRYTPNARQFNNSGELTRLVTGFRGKLGDRFQWEAAFNQNVNRLNTGLSGMVYGPNLQLALAGGFDAAGNAVAGGKYARVFKDFGAPPGLTTLAQFQAAITPGNSVLQPALDVFARPSGVAPTSLANIYGTTDLRFKAPLDQFDARVSGSLVELPAGPLGAAVGVDYRSERLQGLPDQNSFSTGPTAQRWTGATYFDPFSRSRRIDGAFAELRVPITGERQHVAGLRLLEVSAAYRYESYSDAGASRVPKYGLRWRPLNDELTLRGTYSEAFAAPSLFALFGPTTQGFTSTSVIPSVFGVPGQAQARTGSNPGLKPSTARTTSYGVVYSPKAIRGLTLGFDYLAVDQVALVGSAGSAEILRSVNELGGNSPYAAQVALGNWPSNPDASLPAATRVATPGQLGALLRSGVSPQTIFVTDSRINIAGQKVRALDVSAAYAFPATPVGRFSLNASGTYFLHYQFRALPSQPYYEYAGLVTNGGTGSQGSLPSMKWFSNLSWSKDAWSANLSNTYIDSLTDLGAGGITFATSTTLTRVPVPAYSVWDGSLSRTFRNLRAGSRALAVKLTLGVNNLADKMPPAAPQAFGGDAGVDLSTYNPIGRLWYLSVGLKF